MWPSRGRAMRTLVLCLTIALGSIRTVAADPITLSGRGVVTSLGDEEDVCVSCAMGLLGFSFGVGDSLSFTLSFQQPATELGPGDPTFSAFDLGSGTFTLNGGQFTSPITNVRGEIFNTAGGPFQIADSLSLFANHLSDASPRIGLAVSGEDLVGNWLMTDQWPTDVAATLTRAPSARAYLFIPQSEHGTIATLGSLELTQTPTIPEPATIALVALGLVGLGARRWRQRKA
jgi:hypothetical protein